MLPSDRACLVADLMRKSKQDSLTDEELDLAVYIALDAPMYLIYVTLTATRVEHALAIASFIKTEYPLKKGFKSDQAERDWLARVFKTANKKWSVDGTSSRTSED